MIAPLTRVAWRLALPLAALALCAGCGDGSSLAGGGGQGMGGAGGGGGDGGEGPVEGCVAIFGGLPSLPDPSEWSTDFHVPGREPFWVDERGVHYAWTANHPWEDQTYLLVTTFDAESGNLVSNQVFDPFPVVAGVAADLWVAAGGPDGSFAALVNYYDPDFPGEDTDAVLVGNLASVSDYHVWFPPWTALQRAVFHVGWDGEAFAVHAIENAGAQVHLVRLDRQGEVVTPDTKVALMGDFHESKRHTDAESGRTWIASPASGGVFLSGHERDGSPLPGTEAEGAALVPMNGEDVCNIKTRRLGLGSSGGRALLAWYADYGSKGLTCLQEVADTAPVGPGVVLADNAGVEKAIAKLETGWWMGMRHPAVSIDSYRFEGGDLVSSEPLVVSATCPKECIDGSKIRNFSTREHNGALWFGFLDLPVFHIVRVKDGCSYPIYREVVDPGG